ncbi:putative reverse transcriptase domain-containing protein [Tanacetum coccineum]
MTFNWTARGQKKAFQDMKRCIADLPMVTAIQTNEEMIIYLCAAREAVSAVLLTERDSQQMSIYFVSHALQAPEINYSSMEKLVLALDGPRYGLHLNVDKTELFWPKEDPRSRLEGIFPHNISRPLHGVKLLGGPVSVDVDFGSALVMKRVSKTIGLLDAVAKINDPQCELLLIRACAGVSKLYFTMRTCPLCLCMALFVLPWTLLSRGFSDRGDVLNYAFIASRLQSATLQTKLLRDVGIVAHGSTSSDA